MSYAEEIALNAQDDWRALACFEPAEIAEHLAACDREIARCRACSDHFGLVPFETGRP